MLVYYTIVHSLCCTGSVIPSELGKLTNVQYLILYNLGLGGKLCVQSLLCWVNISVVLSFVCVNLGGVPGSLCQMTRVLQYGYFDLYYNYFTCFADCLLQMNANEYIKYNYNMNPCSSEENQIMCELSASTNVATLYPKWRCSSGMPVTQPCQGWTGVTCSSSGSIQSIMLDDSRITGKRYYCCLGANEFYYIVFQVWFPLHLDECRWWTLSVH